MTINILPSNIEPKTCISILNCIKRKPILKCSLNPSCVMYESSKITEQDLYYCMGWSHSTLSFGNQGSYRLPTSLSFHTPQRSSIVSYYLDHMFYISLHLPLALSWPLRLSFPHLGHLRHHLMQLLPFAPFLSLLKHLPISFLLPPSRCAVGQCQRAWCSQCGHDGQISFSWSSSLCY